ncbi:MAG: GAF domain-containing sensor histidine kinase [Anaerolineales bacterium]|nr:GAF domain-containing sensor histidine kinase [Anaerolineales bacterium]
MAPRTARWIAWAIVVIYFILAGAGLTLQGLAETAYAQTELPVLIVLISIVGVWIVTGALIISRHPQHPVGWLLCAGLITASIDMIAAGYAAYDTYVYPGSMPGVVLALVWLKLVFLGPHGIVVFTLIVLLFPAGKFTSPGWRKVAWTTIGALLLFLPLQAVEPGAIDPSFLADRINPLGVSAPLWSYLKPLMWASFTIMVLCYGAAFISLIVRLPTSRGDVRQQIKWLLLPAGLYGIFLLLFIVGMARSDEVIVNGSVALGQLAILGIIIAVVFSIFKFRLYDVQLIQNRTLVYGAMTAFVIGLYVLVVGTLGALFQAQGNLFIALLATGLVALMFQPLRERLQSGVNRLVYGERDDPMEALSRFGSRLEAALAPEEILPTLVETITQTLKLSYAAILLPENGAHRAAAAHGHAPVDPVMLPLTYQGREIGRLAVAPRNGEGSFDSTELRLLRSIARQAGAAVYTVQLTEDLQQSRRRLVTAREEERRRLRRDLHDGLGPTLAALHVQSNALRRLIRSDPDAAGALVTEINREIRESIDDIRRVVYELRPPTLDELGLVGAARAYAAQCSRQAFRGTSLDGDSAGDGALFIQVESSDELPPLPAAVEVAAYYVIREALTNVLHHAAAGRCRVRIQASDALVVKVSDNGIGFLEEHPAGVGLISMRERVEELGGSFAVEPNPGGGTRLVAQFPLPEA